MAAINYKALSTKADFVKAAESLYKRNMSAKKDMQSALICAITHMDAHGDWTTTLKPLLDVGMSFGKNLNVALQEWVLKFTWLAYDEKSKTFSKDREKVMNIEGATETDWWTMEKAAKVIPYDFQKALATFFDGLKKEADRDGSTLDMDAVRSSLMTKVGELVQPEDQIPSLFQRVAVDDMPAVLTQLMGMVPNKAQSQSEEEPEAAAA